MTEPTGNPLRAIAQAGQAAFRNMASGQTKGASRFSRALDVMPTTLPFGSLSSVYPLSAGNPGWIPEDTRFIQGNLGYTRRPVNLAFNEQVRQEHQHTQQQIRASLRTPETEKLFYPGVPLPKSIYRDKDVTALVVLGKVPSDKELKQLFHTLDVYKYSAKTSAEQKAVLEAERAIKHRLAENMTQGPDALINRDYYVIIGDQAYGSFEAYGKALEDIEYF